MTEQPSGPGAAPPAWLIGRWRLRQAETGVEMLPGTLMEFRQEGRLIYRIPLEEEAHVFELEFEVQGNLLRTWHAAAGHAQAVRFAEVDGLLQLDFSGARAWFGREHLM